MVLKITDLPIRKIQPFLFRCPQCKSDVRPANAKCIVCPNCGTAGNTETFSSIERRAA